VSVKDHVILALMANFELCTGRISGLWVPISRVAFVTTMANRTSLLCVVLLLLEGRMRPRVKISSREQGPDFDIVGTCEWLSYVRVSGSQAYGMLVRFFPCRVYINLSRRDTLGYEW
jgi:hypothetical protein